MQPASLSDWWTTPEGITAVANAWPRIAFHGCGAGLQTPMQPVSGHGRHSRPVGQARGPEADTEVKRSRQPGAARKVRHRGQAVETAAPATHA
jgi:hypothetical protein